MEKITAVGRDERLNAFTCREKESRKVEYRYVVVSCAPRRSRKPPMNLFRLKGELPTQSMFRLWNMSRQLAITRESPESPG